MFLQCIAFYTKFLTLIFNFLSFVSYDFFRPRVIFFWFRVCCAHISHGGSHAWICLIDFWISQCFLCPPVFPAGPIKYDYFFHRPITMPRTQKTRCVSQGQPPLGILFQTLENATPQEHGIGTFRCDFPYWRFCRILCVGVGGTK